MAHAQIVAMSSGRSRPRDSTHHWADSDSLGSIVLCGFVGWLVSYLVMPPHTWEVSYEPL